MLAPDVGNQSAQTSENISNVRSLVLSFILKCCIKYTQSESQFAQYEKHVIITPIRSILSIRFIG